MRLSVLEKIRALPDHQKSQFSLIAALCITGAIGAVWSTTLPARFSSLAVSIGSGTEELVEAPREESANLLDTLSDKLAGATGATSDEESSDGTALPNGRVEAANALGALNRWISASSSESGVSERAPAHASTSTSTAPTATPPAAAPKSTTTPGAPAAPTAPSPQATSTPPESPPKPRTILIATTTSATPKQIQLPE